MATPATAVPRLTSLSPGAGCACKLPLAKLETLFASLSGPGLGPASAGPAPGSAALAPGSAGLAPASAGPAPGSAGLAPGSADPGLEPASAGLAPGSADLRPASGGLAPASGDLLVGALEGDDAAVLRLDPGRALVLTTDFFTPIVDDPHDWGAIAAANALSDVYAMGGRPLFAVNLAAWPGEGLPLELLAEVLRGGAEVAAQAGCLVAGGHTIDDPVPKYGMAVVGLAEPDRLMTIDRAAPGDRLILTKPLGTGVIATALKRATVPRRVLRAAVDSMTRLNSGASDAALAAGVVAATDVTGFGLLGHLHRMLAASGAAAELDAGQVPLLPGAAELAADGYVSGGTRANIARMTDEVTVTGDVPPEVIVLLHDAQTSGGLLLAVTPPATGRLLDDLAARALSPAVVGEVVPGPPGRITVRAAAAAAAAAAW